MRVCEVEGCEKKHAARGMCNNHYHNWFYANSPETREKSRKSTAKWVSNNRERYDAYMKEYYNRSDVIEKRKEYNKTHNINQVGDFFWRFNHNKAWRRDGIEKMSELYAVVSCGLSGQEACDLQERILKKAKERLKPSLQGKAKVYKVQKTQ